MCPSCESCRRYESKQRHLETPLISNKTYHIVLQAIKILWIYGSKCNKVYISMLLRHTVGCQSRKVGSLPLFNSSGSDSSSQPGTGLVIRCSVGEEEGDRASQGGVLLCWDCTVGCAGQSSPAQYSILLFCAILGLSYSIAQRHTARPCSRNAPAARQRQWACESMP